VPLPSVADGEATVEDSSEALDRGIFAAMLTP
jgi:hypothetical protein